MRAGFQRFAGFISERAGTYGAFLVALATVVGWAFLGPAFHFSDSWQLVINTGTTIITFLMVFLIQATQNREMRALHLKIDELIRTQSRARNIFASLERATDDELDELESEFRKLRARTVARREAKAAAGRH